MKPARIETAPGVFRIGCVAEYRLRQSFKREDDLLAELANVRAEQRQAREAYVKERERQGERLLILPSMERLRKVLG